MFDAVFPLTRPIADGFQLHQAVYEALHREERDFLFAPTTVGDRDAVVVRGNHGLGRKVEVPEVGVETGFTLRAHPTVKRFGRKRSIARGRHKDDLRLRWMNRRAKEHGFEVVGEPSMRIDHVEVGKPGHEHGFNAVVFTGRLRVMDAEKLTAALQNGIGGSRAWGCGLMLLS